MSSLLVATVRAGMWGAWACCCQTLPGRPNCALAPGVSLFLVATVLPGGASVHRGHPTHREAPPPNCSLEASLTSGTPSSGRESQRPCQGMCQPQSSTPCFGNSQRPNPRKTACSRPPAAQPWRCSARLRGARAPAERQQGQGAPIWPCQHIFLGSSQTRESMAFSRPHTLAPLHP